MTTEQEKAIERCKQIIKDNKEIIKEARKNGDINTIQLTASLDNDSLAIETVLSMLQEQQEENKKKDKIIDYMIDWIRERSIYAVDSHDMLKQYFERKRNEL